VRRRESVATVQLSRTGPACENEWQQLRKAEGEGCRASSTIFILYISRLCRGNSCLQLISTHHLPELATFLTLPLPRSTAILSIHLTLICRKSTRTTTSTLFHHWFYQNSTPKPPKHVERLSRCPSGLSASSRSVWHPRRWQVRSS
jgi:hypothetical protein